MSGDWIKMRIDLRDDPEVFQISAITGLDRFSVIGRLAAFWGWLDRRSVDGRVDVLVDGVDGRVDGVSRAMVDEIVGFAGFAAAMETVKWLVVDGASVYIPKHDKNTTQSGKERSLKNERQAKWRAKRLAEKASNVDAHVDAHVDGVDASTETPTVDGVASTREEKRREDKDNTVPAERVPVAGATSPDRVLKAKDLIAEGVDAQVAADWLLIRKTKKAPLTSTAWIAVKREGQSAGLNPAQTVKTATENNWQGFKASWLKSDSGRFAGKAAGDDWTVGAT